MSMVLPLAPYNPATESWDSYFTRSEYYLKANELTDITDNRKRALFLNLGSSEVFKMAQALVAPLVVQATHGTCSKAGYRCTTHTSHPK